MGDARFSKKVECDQCGAFLGWLYFEGSIDYGILCDRCRWAKNG